MGSKGQLTAAAVIITTAALVLTGCGSSSSSGSQSSPGASSGGSSPGGPFKVLMVLPVTGALNAYATAEKESMQAAVDYVNANGGISGRQATLTVVDDKLDPTTAVTLLQQQIQDGKPDLVWPGATSNESLAMLPVLTRAKILSIGNTQSAKLNDPKTYPYHFGIVTKNSIEAVAASAKLKSDGIKKVALLAANDANGTSVTAAYTTALQADGLTVKSESFAPTDLDMTAQMQRLQAGNPDILLLQAPAGGPAIGYVLKGRTKLGWNIRTLGTTSVGNGNNLTLTSSAADWKNLQLMVYPVNTQNGATKDRPEFKALVDGLKKQNSKFTQLMQIYAAPWDSLTMAKQAIEQAGTSDTEQVAKKLENLTQPAEKPWVEFETEQFTSANHFLELQPAQAFTYVSAGGVQQGIIQSR